VAIIIEHGGHGGATAAPIAKKIFKKYFKLYPPVTSPGKLTPQPL
jgi:cell division protein FtsI/penicillin-binding protein 2